jgi:hypothetical protein
MSLIHLPPTTTTDEVIGALRADGACIVDSLVSNDVMDGVAAEMDPFVDLSPDGTDDFIGRLTRRTGAMVARSRASRELIMHPLVLDTTGVLLKSPAFQLNLTQIISVFPGETVQPLHRDQLGWGFFPFPTDYDVQCNTIWAMTDFTAENGATRLLPGTHLLPPATTATEAGRGREVDRAEMRRGSVLFYTGKVFHGAGSNDSRTIRQGINITYCQTWLRQEENQFLCTPLEVARTLDDDLLRLIGYHASPLGYVLDFEDPTVMVRPDMPKTSFHALGNMRPERSGGNIPNKLYEELYAETLVDD